MNPPKLKTVLTGPHFAMGLLKGMAMHPGFTSEQRDFLQIIQEEFTELMTDAAVLDFLETECITIQVCRGGESHIQRAEDSRVFTGPSLREATASAINSE
jgi:hypothetical protein